MSLQVFLLPDLGEGLTEAELVNWLVEVGDESAWTSRSPRWRPPSPWWRCPRPYAGVVAALHGEAGQTLDVGKPLISVAAATEAAPVVDDAETGGSGNVLIGYGTSGHGAGGRTRPRKTSQVQPAGVPVPRRTPAPQVISPLVRKMARDNGVALSIVDGTGPLGLILRRDVEAALAGRANQQQPPPAVVGPAEPGSDAPVPAGAPQPAAVVDPRSGLDVLSRTPLKGLRKTVAANLARSRSEIPEATVWVDVDATALVQMRQQLKRAEPSGRAAARPACWPSSHASSPRDCRNSRS